MPYMTKGKILLATGIFFPDVGGPAIHVMKIAERLSKEGFEVSVVAYGDCTQKEDYSFEVFRISRKHNKIIQWGLYFLKVLIKSFKSDLIYAFDPTAAGVPGAFSSFLLRKPFFIRVGGDPIWERVVEKGKRFVTIEEYYQNKFYREDSPMMFKIIKMVLNRAQKIIVYNQIFKNFYINEFSVDGSKIDIIKNPAFVREKISTPLSPNPTILFAGRFVSYKNFPKVVNAFAKLKKDISSARLVLIGKGPDRGKIEKQVSGLNLSDSVTFIESLPQKELFEYIKKADVSIAPALNEFNPNFILETLSFGRPVLISKGHGLSVDLSNDFMFDPKNEDEILDRMKWILNKENYIKALEVIHNLPLNQSWEDVTDAHLNLIKAI